MPAVSLIIPLHNAEKYLLPCLRSVQAQTFQDFECLCVNDGSSDATTSIVEDFIRLDNRFTLIQQENKGCSAARNAGIIASNAPYLAFLDQDDVLHPQALETLFYLITSYNADISGFKFKYVEEDFDLSESDITPFVIPELQIEEIDNGLEYFFTKKGLVQIWIRMYKKESLKNLLFPVGIQPGEDNIFTLKAFHLAKKIVLIQEKMYFYRKSSTSIMGMGITEKYIKANLDAAMDLHLYFVRKDCLDEKNLAYMEHYIARALIFKPCISHLLRKSCNTELKNYLLAKYTNTIVQMSQACVFNKKRLRWNQRLASYMFCKKRYLLAKYLTML